MSVPKSTTVLVIGGGPGGGFTASTLAREGIDCVLLEADKFPRYHIGESQLASIRHFYRFIGVEEDFDKHGFTPKVGGGFKLNQHKREGFTDFVSVDPKNISWNFIRSESDDMLLRHAQRVGATVVEETKVTEIQWEGDRTVSATWQNKAGETGSIKFDYVIDGSGRNGIISTKYLKNRIFVERLRNVAVWSYWKNGGKYLAGTSREDSPLSEALVDETGWTWYIPLHDGTVSVGVVMHIDKSNAKKAAAKEAGDDTSLHAHYLRQLKFNPIITDLLKDATMVHKPSINMVNSTSDYSYQSTSYAGPGYRIIGDAGAFVDPLFSSGVHLAMANGLTAVASIAAARKGQVTETEAAAWHSARSDTAYTRFLLVVLGAYEQMRAQESHILSSQAEDNFDRAFDFFRPIIQGTQDIGEKIQGDDLDATIQFLAENAFEPSLPEERMALVAEHGDPVDKTLPKAGDEETLRQRAILKQVAINKVMRRHDGVSLDDFVADNLNGLRLKFKRGELGLERA